MKQRALLVVIFKKKSKINVLCPPLADNNNKINLNTENAKACLPAGRRHREHREKN
jgi:hypothetical protein